MNKQIKLLKQSFNLWLGEGDLKKTIDQRLLEFKRFKDLDDHEWFSELCFCLLTANSKAISAIRIQNEIGGVGFLSLDQNQISEFIRKGGHRFHNTKATYIIHARAYAQIKNIITPLPSSAARNFLVTNIKGLGFKEASHFLRNVGRDDVAIIDRHILRFMHQNNLITEIPKTIMPSFYIHCEDILKQFEMPLDLLDLLLWYKMTGQILK